MLLDQQCAKRFVSGHNFSCAEKLSIYLGFSPCCIAYEVNGQQRTLGA